jgi:hypothetical protein
MSLVLLALAALLLAAPARAGDDDPLGSSLGKQPSVWDRLKAVDRSMQHDADHPDAMGEEPDDEEPAGGGAKEVAPPALAAPAPAAPAPARAPAEASRPEGIGRPARAPALPNLLESPIGRSPLAPEPPPQPDDE